MGSSVKSSLEASGQHPETVKHDRRILREPGEGAGRGTPRERQRDEEQKRRTEEVPLLKSAQMQNILFGVDPKTTPFALYGWVLRDRQEFSHNTDVERGLRRGICTITRENKISLVRCSRPFNPFTGGSFESIIYSGHW